MDILLSILLVVVAVAIMAYVRLSRYRLRVLRDWENSVLAFHEAVEPLIKDSETPDEVLQVLQFLNQKVTDKSAAGHLYHFISRGRFSAFSRRNGKSDQVVAKIRAFFARRPELEKTFHAAVGSAMLAMTFINSCYGQRVRVWLAGIETAKGQEEVITTYQCLDRDGPKGPTCLSPI
jgi:uncharacterized protein YjhX (UPF0386 family)